LPGAAGIDFDRSALDALIFAVRTDEAAAGSVLYWFHHGSHSSGICGSMSRSELAKISELMCRRIMVSSVDEDAAD